MTEEQLHKQTEQERLGLKAPADKSPDNKRRRLIKSAVAIPVIMTLNSGAALARTSNIMRPETDIGNAALIGDNLVCVLPGVGSTVLENGNIDLGNGSTAHYSNITHIDPVSGLEEPWLERQAEICVIENDGFLVSAAGGTWTSIATRTGAPTEFM